MPKRSLLFCGCLLLLAACQPYSSKPGPYELKEPDTFVRMLIPDDNPLTREGVALGRQLFYDPILSADQSLSCAGCHQLNRSFTDGLPVSKGVQGRPGRRSAPSLMNVGYYYKGLFWDGRVNTLEEQVLLAVEDSLELNGRWAEVEARLRNHPDYPARFRKAFGIDHIDQIDRYLVAKAIAQFERTLISADSKFDRVQRGEARFTDAEQRGWAIFFDASPGQLPVSECGHCHIDHLFTNLEFFNNGLDQVTDLRSFPDPGRGAVTGWLYDNGKFRTPSLRNIELTAPYMHDGRFASLNEVIDHYAAGGHYGENVNPNVRKLQLSEPDRSDLIAFLRTLTDTTFFQNPELSNPFETPRNEKKAEIE